MNRLFILLTSLAVLPLSPPAAEPAFRRLPLTEFTDKMQGAWLGQMIGVGWGAPTEFKVKGAIIPEDKMPAWKPEMVNQHDNDDCYVEMTFLRSLELHGFDVPLRQAGLDFANSGYRLWHANKAGRDNLRNGIAPPDSGHPKFNAHADDIDYQIEADFSGIIAPGLPNVAIALGEKFGRLMNYGDGLYAGQFIGGMYAAAYFESDPWKLVTAGLQCVPPGSQYAEMIRDVLKWCRENPDWTRTWELVEAKYHKDPRYTHGLCGKPGGKDAGSIDAKLNGAYIIMGLLYGRGDPDKTIIISCRCGQDSDCNPANAAGVLFAAMGASKVPARFTGKLDLLRKFSFTDYALPQVYAVSEKLARQAVTRAGGRIEKAANGEEVFVIPTQTPEPSALERSWEPGPAANVKFTPEEMAQIQTGAGWKIIARPTPPPIKPLPDAVACAVADRQDSQLPDRVRLTGWVGARIDGNEANRLVKIDTDRLLEGYRKRPGRQSWDGEHVGKWLHAATLAWANTGDPALRAKLDQTVTELSRCQLADGYLGTYLDKARWTEWDVWAHKYNLIGLLTYMRHTGNREPLSTCRRMADLLCAAFGDAPGKRDLIKAGHHTGMAPTSVLEPMVLLYRFTGDTRYLDFCRYILRAWEQANGPHIVSRLLELKRVDKVGNAKAYEMLSCLNGALEYYRTVGGDRQLLEACLNAWQDIVDQRLYPTGTASSREHFQDDFELPNSNNVGETCVTVTWLQFNAQLLRLTGEARFAEQLERVVWNQLLGAQRPDCAAWGYYVQMEGTKPYSATLDGHCCLSSGPRGLALVPTFAVSTDADGVAVNLYDAGQARLTLRDGTPVTLRIETRFPADGRIRITVDPAAAREFAVRLRLPAWSKDTSITPSAGKTLGKDGYAVLRRTWKPGDTLELNLKLEPRLLVGDHLNAGKVAVLYGPLVLAADETLLESELKLNTLALPRADLAALGIKPEPATGDWRTWPGAQWFRCSATTRRGDQALSARLVPFADAGATGGRYKVWLPLAGQPGGNVLLDGVESRSRAGNANGSIIDDDFQSLVVTFNGQPAPEDWYAVTLPAPAVIRRVVVAHGKNFHDGGWFDAGAGKPRVQVQRSKDGAWETVGELADYPATLAGANRNLKPGQSFTLRLAEPLRVVAVRVVGKPASGDNPKQAFSSCGELQAFEQ